MRTDRIKALKLRLTGKSYTEICIALGIPKSTLSGWFSNLELTQKAQDRIKARVHASSLKGLIKRNKLQTHLAAERAKNLRSIHRKEINKLNSNELKLIGTALYWAEGYKRPILRNGKERSFHAVSLSNSDPTLIMLFLRFLREICDVPENQITANVRIYEHMNEENVVAFWKKITGIQSKNFGKAYYGISKSSLGKRPFNRLPYGTIAIRVNRTNIFHKIMGWIEGLQRI
jgi:hypothetical protein